jgi:hypothetical protein
MDDARKEVRKLMASSLLIVPGLVVCSELYSQSRIEYALLVPHTSSYLLTVHGNEMSTSAMVVWTKENQSVLAEQLATHSKAFNTFVRSVGRIVPNDKLILSYESSHCVLVSLIAKIAKDVYDYYSHKASELKSADEAMFPKALLALHNSFANFLYAACASLNPLVRLLAELKHPFQAPEFFIAIYRAAVLTQEADRITSVILTKLRSLLESAVYSKESTHTFALSLMASECKALISVLVDCSIHRMTIQSLCTPSVKLGEMYQVFEQALLIELHTRWPCLYSEFSDTDSDLTDKAPSSRAAIMMVLERVLLPTTFVKVTALEGAPLKVCQDSHLIS